MDPAYVLLVVVVALIAVAAKALNDTRRDCKEIAKQCSSVNNRVTFVEAMLAIYLHHSGFDIPKVIKAIKENVENLEENGGLSIGGCIDVKELYREEG